VTDNLADALEGLLPESGEVVPLNARGRRRRAPASHAPWFADTLKDDRGRVHPVLANLMIPLRSAPEIKDAFSFDEMMRAPILTKALPRAPGAELVDAGELPRPVRDTDVSQLQEWLQHCGLPKIGRDTTHQAVDQRAQERAFHPIRNYLTGLKWGGEARVNRWLSYYLGAEPSAYTAEIGRMFLVAMVARILEPGCKSDHMIVLEGRQGARKSTACSILAGKWFSDSLPDVRQDKDVAQHVRGKWLIEIAELSATGHAEAEALKAFVSRPVERYRPSYGRKEVVEPRQCVFVGTTNKTAYLRDETGGRRFWPVKVGTIDTDALAHDRDQLFAEAVHLYRAGAKWWPDGEFEAEHIRPHQDARFESDPWEDTICTYVSNLSRVKVTDIARLALNIETAKVATADQRRISGVLINHGWTAIKDATGRGYVPPRGRMDAQ
jgi:predicted P-loop ATPase